MPDAASPIAVYGNGVYFSIRFEHALAYPAIAGVPIVGATLAYQPERWIDSDALLAEQPRAIQQFARSYVLELRMVLKFEAKAKGHPTEARALALATGHELIEAIHIRLHRERMDAPGSEGFFGRKPEIAPSRDVDLALQRGGVQGVRFNCMLDGQQATIFYIADRKILSRPQAADPFALTFSGHSSATANARAQVLNNTWMTLDSAARQAIRTVVGLCRRRGDHHINDAPVVLPFGTREALAKPARQGGIGWSVRVNPMLAAGFEEPIDGVQLLPCDEPIAIYDWADLKEIAGRWRRSKLPQAVRDPARAKDLLGAVSRQNLAIRHWLVATDGLRSHGEDAQAWWQLNDANTRLAEVLAAIRGRMVNDPHWLEAFDAAGWPSVPRQAASDFASYVASIKQASISFQGHGC